MGFFGNILAGTLRATVGTAIAVTRDVVTLGGELTDGETATDKVLEKTKEDFEESLDDLKSGDIL